MLLKHLICDYPYSQREIRALEVSLSPGRLNLYRKFANDDDAEALKLYCWNVSLSHSLQWPLHVVEIVLRNAMADCIYDFYGEDWYEEIGRLKRGALGEENFEVQKVEKAKKSIAKDKEDIGHDAIVSRISFGFWEGLLKVEYEAKLWTPKKMFNEIFPVSRNEAFRNINQIKRLRNNIAHHEPVFVHWPEKKFRELYRDYKKIVKVVNWFSPETASWLEHHSTEDFYKAWNSAPPWLSERLPLVLIPHPTANGESECSNWRW